MDNVSFAVRGVSSSSELDYTRAADSSLSNPSPIQLPTSLKPIMLNPRYACVYSPAAPRVIQRPR